MSGQMQAFELQISTILKHAARAHGEREIFSRLVDEPDWRYNWAGCELRSGRLAQALQRYGIRFGDRVSSLAWNTHRHLELMYSVPGMGAVLHTANPRLSVEQIAYTINHAESRLLFFDANLTDLVEQLRPMLRTIERYVLLSGSEQHVAGPMDALNYEALLTDEEPSYEWPRFDENSGAILCYTSGTTGDPKGVLYSHRSTVLHAIAGGLSGALSYSAFDCVMPCSSLYHATGWGQPFIAAVNGAKLVLPCDRFDGPTLHALISAEGVTLSGGVPTIWTIYLAHLAAIGEGTGTLQRLLIGGSAVPRAMAEAFKSHGVTVIQAWGMTETSPLGVVATPTPLLAGQGDEFLTDHILTRQGRMIYGVELKIVDEAGARLPHDGESAGTVMVRGPWVVDRYFKAESPATDADGWFDTGDIATMDRFGFMRITDRKKDVIKSGGEWVSSIDLENAAIGCTGVKAAAVVGVFHPKWEERPIMIVESVPGADVSPAQVRAYLEPRVIRWWLPDVIILASIPLTATGKYDKKVLRELYKDQLRQAD
jgi:3-(methylthio)propionyl---CoA ligase